VSTGPGRESEHDVTGCKLRVSDCVADCTETQDIAHFDTSPAHRASPRSQRRLVAAPARLHDQEDRFVMIVKRVLRRIEPAKEEPEDRAQAKEEEEKRGSQTCNGDTRGGFLVESAI
jgi:hypothetical protein